MQTLPLILEQACNNLAQSASVSAYEGFFKGTVQFDTGIDNANKKVPCVISAVTEASPEPADCPDLGNYVARVSILVKERASKTTTDTTLGDTIFRQFLTASIQQDLMNNAQNLFVHHAWVDNQIQGVDGKMWVSTLNLSVMCCLTQ